MEAFICTSSAARWSTSRATCAPTKGFDLSKMIGLCADNSTREAASIAAQSLNRGKGHITLLNFN